MVFLEMDTYEIWFLWLYLLFMWCISSFRLLFLSPTFVGWILDLLKWFSPWLLCHNTLLSRRFSCLYFSSEYLFPDYYLFHDKTIFFWLTIHKMVNGSSEFMCLPYVKNAKRALIYLTGGQPSNCSRHIEKEWSQREIF